MLGRNDPVVAWFGRQRQKLKDWAKTVNTRQQLGWFGRNCVVAPLRVLGPLLLVLLEILCALVEVAFTILASLFEMAFAVLAAVVEALGCLIIPILVLIVIGYGASLSNFNFKFEVPHVPGQRATDEAPQPAPGDPGAAVPEQPGRTPGDAGN